MSALVDARPAGIDLLFRPGTTLTLTLTWPTGALAGRSFSSTLNGDALALDVVGDVMTVEVADTQTTALAAPAVWLLLEDVGGTDEPIIVGTWAPSEAASAASQASVTVTQGSSAVEVTVQGIATAVGDLTATGDVTVGGDLTVAGQIVGANLPSNLGNTWRLTDSGVKAWSFDPAMVVGGSQQAAGVIQLHRLNVRTPVSVMTAYIWTTVAGSGLTADQNYIGLYNSAGTRLASVDTDVAFVATPGLQTIALGSTIELAAGFYWVAFLTNGGTSPTFARGVSQGGSGITPNMNLPASQFRAATNGTSQTTLPASITPSSNGASGTIYWCALA